MIGGVAVREAPDSMYMNINATGSNASDAINVELRDKSRVQVAVMVTTLAGLIQVSLPPTEQPWLISLFIQSSSSMYESLLMCQLDFKCFCMKHCFSKTE